MEELAMLLAVVCVIDEGGARYAAGSVLLMRGGAS